MLNATKSPRRTIGLLCRHNCARHKAWLAPKGAAAGILTPAIQAPVRIAVIRQLVGSWRIRQPTPLPSRVPALCAERYLSNSALPNRRADTQATRAGIIESDTGVPACLSG